MRFKPSFFLFSFFFFFPLVLQAQTCPADRLCGAAVCCSTGQICFQQTCTNPGAPCQKSSECGAGEICAFPLRRCLPKPTTDPTCTYRPPLGVFSPTPLWEWHGSQSPVLPAYKNVMMTPVVMALQDTNNDGKIDAEDIPSVIFMSYVSGGSNAEEGLLRALRGDNGQEIFTVTQAGTRVNALGALAVGDIDNDGLPDIVAPRYAGQSVSLSGLHAFSNTGQLKWTAKFSNGQIAALPVGWGGAALADLDGDGKVEVVLGHTVIRGSDGVVLCQGSGGNGTPNTAAWSLSIPADLDGDGKQEIVTGSHAYRHDCSTLWASGLSDGYLAIADLNGDGKPEVVVMSGGVLRVQNGQTGALLFSVAIPGGGGGPPTIADFNGDGKPDIATAGRSFYVIYSPNFTTSSLSLLWQFQTQDFSSSQTGSSVFDFEGDGKAEAVYNDEVFMRVFNGQSGAVLFSQANNSATTLEYPVIVDVNNDGRSNIVISSNNGVMANIRVFRDALDNWVDTRNVWNQHAYSVTNICTGDAFCPPGSRFGQIPAKPLPNWTTPGLNNFRQNFQGKGLFEAADLVISDLHVGWSDQCPLQLRASLWVVNAGAKRIPAQVPISFYEVDAQGNKVRFQTLQLKEALNPGEAERIEVSFANATQGKTFLAVVDDDGTGKSTRNECREQNNSLSALIPNASTTEICDGRDNDCNGKIDDGFPDLGQPCTAGVGLCEVQGTLVCKPDGSGTMCNAVAGAPSPETCNGKDDDCNGQIDDQMIQPCQTSCGTGVETCQNGLWTGCTARQPSPETCNGQDDDCDGQVDNGLTQACQTACGAGVETCQNGLWVGCTAKKPLPEDCNGQDDDCNGTIDDGIPPKVCQGACGQGTATCQNGQWTGCSGPQPQTEICDGKDNDCDGKIDNDVKRTCQTACGEGFEVCNQGIWGSCSAPLPVPETCDGRDNNCDGKIDNGADCGAGQICSEGRCRPLCRNGECPAGQRCVGDICIDICPISCPQGTACVRGQCVDACQVIRCPQGTLCKEGLCLPSSEPPFEGGGESSSSDGGPPERPFERSNDQGQEAAPTDDPKGDAAREGSNDAPPSEGHQDQPNANDKNVTQDFAGTSNPDPGQSPGGCGCSTGSSETSFFFLFSLFFLLLLRRRV